jgi:hypothetical protein
MSLYYFKVKEDKFAEKVLVDDINISDEDYDRAGMEKIILIL